MSLTLRPIATQPLGELCAAIREDFSPYLDGTLTGHEMQSMAAHLERCGDCASDFAGLRDLQETLASLRSAKAPARLAAQLHSAIAIERERGTHLAWSARLARLWRGTLEPMAWRCAVGGLMMVGPAAVEANDEPLGAVTAPHYLYSEVPPQAIDFGAEAPVLVEAMVDEQGRVYDYTIVSGPTDPRIERRVQANLLSSVFRPATVFGVPVSGGRVVMTYSGISVRG